MQRFIKIVNKNYFAIWIQTQTNNNGPPLGNVVKIDGGQHFQYDISNAGWAGRLWPKIECDRNGINCGFGQSIAPCPSGGCQPPVETKIEFNFPRSGTSEKTFFDISLVRDKYLFI